MSARIAIPLGLVLALAIGVILSRAHSTRALPVTPEGVTYARLRRTGADWTRAGYIEMVGPIRPPTSEDGRVSIRVYVKWPEGARIHVVDAGGKPSLTMPEGTLVDRVELLGTGDLDAEPDDSFTVLDVRGTTFLRDDQVFHVLRPAPGGDLLGLEWRRGPEADGAATEHLAGLLLNGHLRGPSDHAERAGAAARLRTTNACASCHVPERPGRKRVTDPGIVNRGTDGSGLFQIADVLKDSSPFETYRPRDGNLKDSFITRRCGDDVTDAPSCQNGMIAVGQLDVVRAVRAGDRHAIRLCRSRLAVATRLDRRTAEIDSAVAECHDGERDPGSTGDEQLRAPSPSSSQPSLRRIEHFGAGSRPDP